MSLSFSANPVVMRSPKPPAPMKAAIVAVPTLDAGQDRGRGQRQFDVQQGLAPRQPQRQRGRAQAGRYAQQAGTRIAHDRQQRICAQRHQRRRRADAAEQRNQDGEQGQ
jgi:hypothetical protein